MHDKDTSFTGVPVPNTYVVTNAVDNQMQNPITTSLTGVHDKDTSFTVVPVPNTYVATNANDESDAESDHNSVEPRGQ